MPPDAATIYRYRAAGPLPPAPVELGEEQRAALVRAADKAGDRGLVPTLERLVAAYVRETATAAAAPRLGKLHERLRGQARRLEHKCPGRPSGSQLPSMPERRHAQTTLADLRESLRRKDL